MSENAKCREPGSRKSISHLHTVRSHESAYSLRKVRKTACFVDGRDDEKPTTHRTSYVQNTLFSATLRLPSLLGYGATL